MVFNGKNQDVFLLHRQKVIAVCKRKRLCHGIICAVHGRLFHVLYWHLAPNFLPSILFMIIMSVRTAIAEESTLSFLGLGLPIETISLQYARTCPECLCYARVVDDLDSRPFFNTSFFMPHRDRKLVPRAHEP